MPATTGVYPELAEGLPHVWRGRLRPRKLSVYKYSALFCPGIHNPKMFIRHRWKLRIWICCGQLAGEGARPTPHTKSSSASPLSKYRYRRRLPHLQKADADLFVTFCTAGPLILSSAARDLVLEHCLREHVSNVARPPLQRARGRPSPANCRKPRTNLLAAVVMPDHVHLLLSPLRDGEGWPFPLVDILLPEERNGPPN